MPSNRSAWQVWIYWLICFNCVWTAIFCVGDEELLRFGQNGTWLAYTSSWAVKIPANNRNATELHLLADRIAFESGLINRGQIGGLVGHYLFIHAPTFDNKTAVRDLALEQVQKKITYKLVEHPEIQWSRQEVVRMRYKRSLQFKDQYFPSQWHLVGALFIALYS